MKDHTTYQPGDEVNGYRLTEQGTWVPISPEANAPGSPEEPTIVAHDDHVAMIGAPVPSIALPPKKKHTTRNVLLILGVIVLLMFAGCVALVGGAVNEASKPTVPGSVSTGLGANDATEDVVLGPAKAPEAGVTYLLVTVTNRSAKRSDYYIEITADAVDGSRVDFTNVAVYSLDPGQTTQESALFTNDLPADVTFRVVQVQRTASI